MTLPQGIAVKILESIGFHLWGFKPNMMRHFVHEHGSIKSVLWFIKNMPRYERILKKWGPIRTHLLSTALSTVQGCAYCTYGHAYALQLHYFNQTDNLFPLDEDALFKLHGVSDDMVYKRLATALTQAGLQEEVQWLNRLVSLQRLSPTERIDRSRNNSDDSNLCHLMDMFSVLNACGIKYQVVPDEAHDPVNQDMPLRARYSARRGT